MNIEFGVTTIVRNGNNIEVIATFPDNSVDSIVTDPPYELGFMGKSWDSSGIAYNVELWQECLRVLKPGGHLLAFGGSRTYHRMACAIEDAGFQIRDQIMWVYGSGFPKSLNIGKAIDKAAGVEFSAKPASGVGFMNAEGVGGYNTTLNQLTRVGVSTPEAQQWDGWGTALKPAHEPIVMARKPLDGTVANNVLTHGVGGINIDGCRIEGEPVPINKLQNWSGFGQDIRPDYKQEINNDGRFPANFIHDGSDEVLELLGNSARFFYCAKAGKKERNAGLDELPTVRHSDRVANDLPGGDNPRNRTNEARQNFHPTVKPLALMRYLVRLVTPPNGVVLDPFAGSGSTLVAATLEGFSSIGIEITKEYIPIIEARIEWAKNNTNQQTELDL